MTTVSSDGPVWSFHQIRPWGRVATDDSSSRSLVSDPHVLSWIECVKVLCTMPQVVALCISCPFLSLFLHNSITIWKSRIQQGRKDRHRRAESPPHEKLSWTVPILERGRPISEQSQIGVLGFLQEPFHRLHCPLGFSVTLGVPWATGHMTEPIRFCEVREGCPGELRPPIRNQEIRDPVT